MYEPVSNDQDQVLCYLTDSIYLAFRSYIERKVKGEQKVYHPTIRQCFYCENDFVKSKEALEKHNKVCASNEGIIYTFENGE